MHISSSADAQISTDKIILVLKQKNILKLEHKHKWYPGKAKNYNAHYTSRECSIKINPPYYNKTSKQRATVPAKGCPCDRGLFSGSL